MEGRQDKRKTRKEGGKEGKRINSAVYEIKVDTMPHPVTHFELCVSHS